MGKGLTKLFLIIEGLLLLLTAFQLVQDWELLILLLIGLIMTRASKGAFGPSRWSFCLFVFNL